jgi:aryl-phospho-beta-D-glucosidase BglC (GH1 family)
MVALSPSRLIGVNFHGYGSSVYQNGSTPVPPENYIEDSFRIFSNNGITCVRITLYWESWEHDTREFNIDLETIASTADKYGIKCIYDNHQWECSSWIGSGIGFPNSLMSNYYERAVQPGKIPSYSIKRTSGIGGGIVV